jgi:hypothetical protein
MAITILCRHWHPAGMEDVAEDEKPALYDANELPVAVYPRNLAEFKDLERRSVSEGNSPKAFA